MDNNSDKFSNLSPAKQSLLKLLENDRQRREQKIVALPRQNNDVFEIPLSFSQQGVWLLDQVSSGSVVYNIPLALRLSGLLRVVPLENSLREILHRHETLRTTFSAVTDKPVQVISSSLMMSLQLVDLSHLPGAEMEAQRMAEEETLRPFDLAVGPLIRAVLLKLSEQEHVLLVTMHHIISDGWSVGVFFRELSALYNAFSQGLSSPLPALPIQYADYVVWQRERLQGAFLEEQLAYWKGKLAGAPELLDLPTDRPHLLVQTSRAVSEEISLSPEVTRRLYSLCQREGATLFMVLLAAFQVLLLRYTGQEDIVVGSPIAGRTQQETEGLIGFFVNTLPLRTDLSGDPSFRELLGRVKETCLGAYEHQELPFEKIVEELAPQRNPGHTPLIQTLFSLNNVAEKHLSFYELTVTPVQREDKTVRFDPRDLALSVAEAAGHLNINIGGSAALFDASTIERLLGHYQVLLEGIVADPDACLSALLLLTEAERHQLVAEFNDTAADYPKDKCIHQLFEEQVEKTPEAVAVVFENAQLTYGELNARSNQLAHYLRTLGVGPEVLVGLCVERSLEMIVGLLGILKAGGAYVPLDPSYPKDRLAFMLNDAAPAVLLTQERLLKELPQSEARVLCLDRGWPEVEQESGGNPSSGATSENLAYVIYTSGSTGKPKGAGVDQRGLSNLLCWFTSEFGIAGADRTLLVSSISFDLTQKNVFAPLITGGQLHLLAGGQYDPTALAGVVTQKQITLLNCTPSAFYPLVDGGDQELAQLASLRCLFLGGEPISLERLRPWTGSTGFGCQIVNSYGPTECTDVVAFHRLKLADEDGVVPIGRPVANTQAYVLDAQGRPVPLGVAGELYTGGVQVGRGYLNRPELTAEKFILDPFSGKPGSRLYKTGDLVKWRADGNLEFLGRLDHQVKIRGFRIELGEIEAVLREHPAVKEAVVVAREDVPGDKRLVAYIVEQNDQPLEVSILRSLLVEHLPVYMVPSAFVILKKMPLTPSGKLDRRGLPVPDISALAGERGYVAPRTPVEEVLCGIWAEVLRVEKVSIHDNFFELGGDSLLAVQMVSKANRLGLELLTKDLFMNQSVSSLTLVVGKSINVYGEQGALDGKFPLTPIQHRFFDKSLHNPNYFNTSGLFEVYRDVNEVYLKEAIHRLSIHHDVLRTRFRSIAGIWQQYIVLFEDGSPTSIFDLTEVPEPQQGPKVTEIMQTAHSSIDLTNGPLFRVGLIRCSESFSYLFFVIHHIIVDSFSWRLLLEDFELIYKSIEGNHEPVLPRKTTSFKEWAKRLEMLANTSLASQDYEYWLNRPWSRVKCLPLDFPDRIDQDTRSSYRSIITSFDRQDTQLLTEKIVQENKMHCSEVVLAVVAKVITEWLQASTLSIEIVSHARRDVFQDEVNLSRTVGWFTTHYPFVVDLTGASSLEEVLSVIKNEHRAVPNYGMSYGLLRYMCKDKNIQHQMRAVPQPQIMFKYDGEEDSGEADDMLIPINNLKPSNNSKSDRAGFIIKIGVSIRDGCLRINIGYSHEVLLPSTIEILSQQVEKLIRSTVQMSRELE